MKPNPHNPYGYKVCYQEKGSSVYIRYFLTYTYKQAVAVMQGYIRYPPTERETGRQLNHPRWFIFPITKKEVLRGIWREGPF